MFVSCVHSRVVEGSWEGIAGCVVHVDVHRECVCCGWMQCSMLAEGCSWLAVVHGYEISFIPTECFIRKKLCFDCYSAVFIMAFTACAKLTVPLLMEALGNA